jgi:hypothetical protein
MYVDLQGNVPLFQKKYVWAECKRYYASRPEKIQSSCQKLLHVDFHLTTRENRKTTDKAESFMRQD